jgi:hypothetical protein
MAVVEFSQALQFNCYIDTFSQPLLFERGKPLKTNAVQRQLHRKEK